MHGNIGEYKNYHLFFSRRKLYFLQKIIYIILNDKNPILYMNKTDSMSLKSDFNSVNNN